MQAPALYANWMFGDVTKAQQIFRITKIEGSQDYRRDITALQYNPLVYDFSRYSSSIPPMLEATSGPIGQVTSVTAYEETYVAGPTVVSEAQITWVAPADGLYAGADILARQSARSRTTPLS